MGCISKVALFILNFAIFAAGVVVVALASIVIHKDKSYGNLLGEGTFTIPVVVLIAGLIVVTIGFLGCCGAMKESSCMLKTYAFIVIILLLAEFTLGILVLVYPSKAQDTIKTAMNETFKAYGNGDMANNDVVDSLESDLHCCGVNGFADWRYYDYGENGNVTKGCCIEDTSKGKPCYMDMNTKSEEEAAKTIFTRGCYYALKDEFQGAIVALGVVLFALVVVQVLAVTCACGLAKNSGSGHYA